MAGHVNHVTKSPPQAQVKRPESQSDRGYRPSWKLLLLITELSMGGAARVFRDQADELANRFTVHEAVFNERDGNAFPGGNKVFSLDVNGGGGLPTKVLNLAKRVWRLRRIKRDLKINLSISHLEGAHYVDVLSRQGEKTILCVHGSILHNPVIRDRAGWLRLKVAIPWLYNRADRIVAVSRDIKPELTSLGVEPEKISIINNFFDVEKIARRAEEPLEPAERALYADGPVLVTSGRLHPQKNQSPLLEIFSALLKRQRAKLLLIGDGELRNDLKDRARLLGLRVFDSWSDHELTPHFDVYFMGLKENPFKYIRPATLFVFPSDYEGFPLALCEAMICGVPVVSTDCPTGPREILAPATPITPAPIRSAEEGEYGLLMPLLSPSDQLPADIAVWVETLERLLLEPGRRERLAERAKERMKDFTAARIVPQWVRLIEEVLAEP